MKNENQCYLKVAQVNLCIIMDYASYQGSQKNLED